MHRLAAFAYLLLLFAGVNASEQVSVTAPAALTAPAAIPSGLSAETQRPTPVVAIIIDDIGNNYRRGRQIIQLPGQYTYSFLPFTRHASTLANRAHNLGKEVMVHLPMQNVSDRPLGPAGLHDQLPFNEFQQILQSALSGIPYASGLNNHMGSALTTNTLRMEWLMDELRQHNMYFVDSRTTPETVASSVALRKRILSSSRDVFLDNERTPAAIHIQFEKLLEHAHDKGSAIAIGHPYPETIQHLGKHGKTLLQRGIRLMPVSTVLKIRARGQGTQMVFNQEASLQRAVH